jgi:multidrug resistance efflux pump
MPVKLHGAQRPATVTPIRPEPSGPHGKKKPEAFKAPWTIGRVVYFIVLMTVLGLGGSWVVGWLRFVTATGVLERDVDRLAPREKGRISKIAVKNGDAVKQGQPLVWLDYAQGFISDADERQHSRDVNRQAMQERRREIDRLSAQARTQLAGWQSTARGMEPQRRTLKDTQLSAVRLRAQGAATQGEVSQVALQLQQVEQQLATAREQATAQEAVLARLQNEASALDQVLAAEPAAPPAPDVGIISASRDGVVAWVAFHAGEVVQPQDAVILLADDHHIRVRAFVQPKDAQSLEPGKGAWVLLPSGERLPARVDRLGLLASVAPPTQTPTLGKPTQPTLTAQPLPPVDPNAAFLLADVTVLDVKPDVAARLAAGAPCEVRVERNWRWLRDLVPFGG